MELLANVDVDDLEKGIAFYTQAFDLKVGRRFATEAVELLGASAVIYLLVKAAGTPASTVMHQKREYRRHWTPVHLDLVVEDVRAAVTKAVAAGAVLEGEIETHRWGYIAHLADPFGHGLCLIEFRGRGYDEIADPRP
ncbi:MAG TPA: VOC family protein [Gammaproteobacteria bacterium]|nr:VOC family protein [Gammaproteobacteria bacterium]